MFFVKTPIFRCNAALQACTAFDGQVPTDVQCAKLADLWPIENVWGHLEQEVKMRQPQTAAELKQVIEEEWSKINADKALCRYARV